MKLNKYDDLVIELEESRNENRRLESSIIQKVLI